MQTWKSSVFTHTQACAHAHTQIVLIHVLLINNNCCYTSNISRFCFSM